MEGASAYHDPSPGPETMVPKNDIRPPPTVWAYAYEIFPPQTEDRLQAVKAVLEDEHSKAKLKTRTWEGRFVPDERITHILVVSDGPDLDRDVNRRVEACLKAIHAEFTVTIP